MSIYEAPLAHWYIAENDELRDVIRRNQWAGWRGEAICPECGVTKASGKHNRRCSIGKALTCDECDGEGTVGSQAENRYGFMDDVEVVCHECGGTGTI